MKKALKIFLPTVTMIIIVLFFFKNDLMLWRVTNKYEKDPSSINPSSDIPKAICGSAQEEILNAYLAKPVLSEESLAATVELIAFCRSCLSKSSTKDKKPLNKKIVAVLMDVYRQTTKGRIHSDIASFLQQEDIKAFYRYFEMTQKNGLPFYNGNSSLEAKYPKLFQNYSAIEKDLWCKNVRPKIEADFKALLESDTLNDGVLRLQLLRSYEEINCNNDQLHLRKLQFSAWSKLLVDLEREFYASKNDRKIIDFNDLINASHKLTREAKTELESTSFVALLGLEPEAEKKLVLYFLDFPIESRIMCWKIAFYLCYEYGTSMDKDILKKAKEWRKIVAQKYPKLAIEKVWDHQMGLAELKEVYREHGEF